MSTFDPTPTHEKKKKKKLGKTAEESDEVLAAKCQIGCLRRILYLTSFYFRDKSKVPELLKF